MSWATNPRAGGRSRPGRRHPWSTGSIHWELAKQNPNQAGAASNREALDVKADPDMRHGAEAARDIGPRGTVVKKKFKIGEKFKVGAKKS